MIVTNTPVESYPKLGLYVKREDLCCPGGPNFSKARGVYAHIERRTEKFIGVLDTSHSQGGWAVAKACAALGKTCVGFYPVRKGQSLELPPVQKEMRQLGAQLLPLPAGRSCILYHRAKAHLDYDDRPAYMMPNALKLSESVSETAHEVKRTKIPRVDTVLVSASSATIAAGLLLGLRSVGWRGRLIVHMGYDRPEGAIIKYMMGCIPLRGLFSAPGPSVLLVNERYGYADAARPGPTPPFPCNEFYDLKAFRWWMAVGRAEYGKALLWNIG